MGLLKEPNSLLNLSASSSMGTELNQENSGWKDPTGG